MIRREVELPKSRPSLSLLIMLVIFMSLSALQVPQSAAGSTGASWASKAPMQESRVGLGGAGVNDKIYAIGGYLGGYNHSRTNEEYDPETAI